MKDTIYAVVVTIFSFLQDELIMYTDCSRIKEKVKEGNYGPYVLHPAFLQLPPIRIYQDLF